MHFTSNYQVKPKGYSNANIKEEAATYWGKHL